jgi:CheY-like chemotaxis protein
MADAARLLIADDQTDVLEAPRLLLSQENFSLQLVTSPAALIDRVRAEKWDAVLMDLNYSRDTTSENKCVATGQHCSPGTASNPNVPGPRAQTM